MVKFTVITTGLGKTTQLHTVLRSSYTLRYYNACGQRAILSGGRSTGAAVLHQVTASKGGACSRSGAQTVLVTSVRHREAQISK